MPVFSSPYQDLALPKGNIIGTLHSRYHGREHLPALVCGTTLKELSYKELKVHTLKWCRYFSAKYPNGSVVAFIAPNSLEVCVGFLGCAAAGMIYLGIYGGCTADEMISQMVDIDVVCIIHHVMYTDKVNQVLTKLEKKTRIETIQFGECSSFWSVADNLEPMEEVQLTGSEVHCIFHTSGSTGKPKATLLTNDAVNAFLGILEQEHWHIPAPPGGQTVVFAHTSFVHQFGIHGVLLLALCLGQKVYVKEYDQHTFLEDIVAFKVTKLPIRPSLMRDLMQHHCTTGLLRHIKTVVSTGMNAPETLERQFRETFPHVFFQQCYGATEVMHITLNPVNGGKVGAGGVLINNVKMKVIDVETGECLPANVPGEIYVHSPSAFLEYMNMAEFTAQTKSSEGWVRTGDLGYVDSDGYLIIKSRLKDIIKCGNFLAVYPAEIEGTLHLHPSVLTASVVSVPHPDLLEVPRAYVVLKKDVESVDCHELEEFVRLKMSEKNHLRGGVAIVQNLPTTVLGKVDKVKLKEMAKKPNESV